MSYKNSLYFVFIILISLILIPTVSSDYIQSDNSYYHTTSSCTIFTAAIGDTVYFGNNEDYKYNNAYRWYIPAQNVSTEHFGIKEIYGAVFFGFDNNDDIDVDKWEQGGMNEYGLCFDANGLPDIQLNLDPTASYPYTPNALAQVLWDCRNVSEVIDWFKNIKWYGTLGGQFHYADSTGDAVVVSVNSTGQWVFTRKESTFLVSTNFNLNDTSNGYYPCDRYDTATLMFEEISTEEDLTVSRCSEILYAVHQEGTYATKYSNICDPVNLEFYFNCGDEFSENEKFDLTEKLADADSFEERSIFFGVTGVDKGVLVNTEKIDIQFETISETEETTAFLMMSILCLSACVMLLNILKKKNHKLG